MSTKTTVRAGLNHQLIEHPGVEEMVEQSIKRGIQSGLFNGATVGIVTPQGREILYEGRVSEFGGRLKGREVYDIASLTKAMLSLLYHVLASDSSGRLSKVFAPDVLVKHFLQLEGKYADLLTIRDLLCFTAEFVHSTPISKMVAQGLSPIDEILKGGLSMPPGKSFQYCNHSSILLGKILEIATRMKLDELMHCRLFSELEMPFTSFRPERIEDVTLSDFVPTENGLRGVAHDAGARSMLIHGNHPIGSAGLFSTAGDMLKPLALILDRGLSPSSKALIPKDVVKGLGYNHIGPTGEKFGNGFGLWSRFCKGFEGAVDSSLGIFKGSYTGCYLVCLPHLFDRIGFFIGTDFLALGDRNKKPLHEWVVTTVSDVVKLRRKQAHDLRRSKASKTSRKVVQ